jgi:hypothetical protein
VAKLHFLFCPMKAIMYIFVNPMKLKSMKKMIITLCAVCIMTHILYGQGMLTGACTAGTGIKSEGFSVLQWDDGQNYIYCGPGFIIADSMGAITGYRQYLSSGYRGGEICKTKNGEVLMLVNSTTVGPGAGDVILFRMDKTGAIRWIRVYGTANAESAADLVELNNGNIIIAMSAEGFDVPSSLRWILPDHSSGNAVIHLMKVRIPLLPWHFHQMKAFILQVTHSRTAYC